MTKEICIIGYRLKTALPYIISINQIPPSFNSILHSLSSIDNIKHYSHQNETFKGFAYKIRQMNRSQNGYRRYTVTNIFLQFQLNLNSAKVRSASSQAWNV